MKLIVITGACGAGKSTVRDALEKRLNPERYACIDTDELGVNWWDYAGTQRESRFSDDCLREAVKRAHGRDLIFASCLNPQDYISKHNIPEEIEATFFAVLCPSDEAIEKRLRSRPADRGFTSDDAILPHIGYNRWFRKNKGKFQLFIDNTVLSVDETAESVMRLIKTAIE